MAEREIKIVIKAEDDYSAVLKRFQSQLTEAGVVSGRFEVQAGQVSKQFNKLTSASEYAAKYVKNLGNVIEGMGWGIMIGAASAATEMLVKYYNETYNTTAQANALNNSIRQQAEGWKLLPKPIEGVTSATVGLYNAQLKYLQLIERDNGDTLAKQIETFERMRKTSEFNAKAQPGRGEYFAKEIANLDVKIAEAKAALERHREIMGLKPTTAGEVNTNLSSGKALGAEGKLLEAQEQLRKTLLSRMLTDEKSSASVELSTIENLYKARTITAEAYFAQKSAIETKAFDGAKARISDEISQEYQTHEQKINLLYKQKASKAEIEAAEVAHVTKLIDLGYQYRQLDDEVTQTGIKNAQGLAAANAQAYQEKLNALSKLAESDKNDPYKAQNGEGGQLGDAYMQYQMGGSQLEALQAYNTQRLGLMAEAGATQFEMESEYERLTTEMKNREYQIRLGAASGFAGGMANFFQNLYTASGKKNRELFEMAKAFAIAEAVMNTAKAATAALAFPPGPPISFAYVAAAVAAGAAQIATIASSKPGGSGGAISAGGTAMPPYSGGSYSAQPVPTRLEQDSKPTQSIVLNIHTQDPSSIAWDKMVENNIAPALERLSRDHNYTLDIKVAQR